MDIWCGIGRGTGDTSAAYSRGVLNACGGSKILNFLYRPRLVCNSLLHLRGSWNSPSRSRRTVHATSGKTDFSIKAILSITSVRPLYVSLAEIGCLQILARLLLPIGPWGWLATMNA
jgi:hypothetical protein